MYQDTTCTTYRIEYLHPLYVTETSIVSEDEVWAADEYNSQWDDWDRERGCVSGGYAEKGLQVGDWMNAAESDGAEWMIDGYWEGDEEE